MTNLGLGFGSKGALATSALALLVAGGCNGDHPGAGADDSVPAASCTFMPEMIVEVPEARWAEAIALHQQHVYLRLRGSVVRVPKTGGPLEPFSDTPPVSLIERPTLPEISEGEYIYTLDHHFGEIVRVKRDGSSREPLANADVESDSFVMALHGPWLYWTSSNGTLHRVPKAGGVASTMLASFGPYDDDDYRGLLAVDADGVFFLVGPPGRRSSDSDPLWLARACR